MLILAFNFSNLYSSPSTIYFLLFFILNFQFTIICIIFYIDGLFILVNNFCMYIIDLIFFNHNNQINYNYFNIIINHFQSVYFTNSIIYLIYFNYLFILSIKSLIIISKLNNQFIKSPDQKHNRQKF